MNELRENRERRRFEMEVEGTTAFVTYRRQDGRIHLLHTEVPPALSGRGVGSALARAVLDQARQEGAKVVPVCDFIANWVVKHPDYADLVAKKE